MVGIDGEKFSKESALLAYDALKGIVLLVWKRGRVDVGPGLLAGLVPGEKLSVSLFVGPLVGSW